MRKNVGLVDSVIRILVGIVIIVAGFMNHSWWGIVGIVPLATGITGWCGLYQLFGIHTTGKK